MADEILSKHLKRDDDFGTEREKATSGKYVYKAFGIKHKAIAVDLRKADGQGRCPGYISFIDVLYSSRQYSAFVLLFHHVIVEVKGLHLKPVVRAFKARRCDFIEEISGEFESPTDGDTVIQSIMFDAKWKRQADKDDTHLHT